MVMDKKTPKWPILKIWEGGRIMVGARPSVVDQVLHDLTHDMENIGIQGREAVQSDHVQKNPPTAASVPSLQTQTSLSRPTSLLGHGSRMGTISYKNQFTCKTSFKAYSVFKTTIRGT